MDDLPNLQEKGGNTLDNIFSIDGLKFTNEYQFEVVAPNMGYEVNSFTGSVDT